MRTDLLQALKTELETNVKNKNFCIDQWRCGTVGCAISVAADMPIFQEEGLQLVNLDPDCSYKLDPVFEKHSGWKAVYHLFVIESHIAEYLFAPWRYASYDKVTPKDVATRIGKVLEGHNGSGE